MRSHQDSSAKGVVAAILALVFTVLAVASMTATTYLAGLWTAAAMAWIFPLFIGGIVTSLFVVGAMISAGFAMGEARTRRLGMAAVVLTILGLVGGVYGGCRKGWHDLRCHSSCSEFW
jgi:hypothetical protein